jgi:exopolyphosphatase/guanosine-5'-triphosphate,3'-diphosphate pyrophosphatase
VAVVDIGSNSVRLVVFEGGLRSPTALFNEKGICELGRGVAISGRLDQAAMADSLALLRRFRLLARQVDAAAVHAVATAAVRDAANGAEYLALAQAAIGAPIAVLSGSEEARLAAAGVLSAHPAADGLVGDLGGGSLELVDLAGGVIGRAETAGVGTLRLIDQAPKVGEAVGIVDRALAGLELPPRGRGRTLFAVGGTWRALAAIHMERRRYPLHVIDHYTIEPDEALEIAGLVRGLSPASLRNIPNVSSARVKTIPHGAMVLERLIVAARPSRIVFSAKGLREGLVHTHLPRDIAAQDPLVASAREMGRLRGRSLEHCEELSAWTDPLFEGAGRGETAEGRRLRHAACLLSDIAWRAHPDYRGEHALDLIAHGSLTGVDHAGRAFLAIAVFSRHGSIVSSPVADALAGLLDEEALGRARWLGAAMRLANDLAASQPGLLPLTRLRRDEGELVLTLPAHLADIAGGRLDKRLAGLAERMGLAGRIETLG